MFFFRTKEKQLIPIVMKKNFSTLVLIAICTFAFAQNDYQGATNSKVSMGVSNLISGQDHKRTLTDASSVHQALTGCTKRIHRLPVAATNEHRQYLTANNHVHHGIIGLVEIGGGMGIGDLYGVDLAKLNCIIGYIFNPYISVGIGTGVRYYIHEHELFFPLFADIRIYFRDRKVSPYFALDAGMTINMTPKIGSIINPMAGVCVRVTDKNALYVGLGYHMQPEGVIEGYSFQTGNHTKPTLDATCISLNVGLNF